MTQQARIWFHATNKNARQTKYDANGQSNIDGHNDNCQKCDKPHKRIQIAKSPAVNELRHLHQHTFQWYDNNGSQNAL